MFVSSKVRAKITDDDPVFKTRYLGNTEVFVPNGTGCTNAPVQRLWDNSGEEKTLRKLTTVINIHGIFIKDTDKKNSDRIFYPIENISFCNAESIANGKIFSWIAKEENSPKLLCHAVLCSTPEKAKSMALVMSRAFQIAYKEWKIEQNNAQRYERKSFVKTKTADINLQLKSRYQTSQTSASVQLDEHRISGHTEQTEEEIVNKNRDSQNDARSLDSSASTEKSSSNSQYKDSESQTGIELCNDSNQIKDNSGTPKGNDNVKSSLSTQDSKMDEEKDINSDSNEVTSEKL